MSSDYKLLLKGKEFYSPSACSLPGPSRPLANTSPLVSSPGLLVQAGLKLELRSVTQPCHNQLYQT